MAISMYSAFIPQTVRMLGNLSKILAKAESYAEQKKLDGSVLPNLRLFPDMFALAKQVQIATDQVKGGAARLAGVDVPKFEDNEATIPELRARIEKTITFLDTFSAAQIDGSEVKDIAFKIGDYQLAFNGQQYLLTWVLPNFYFHVTTTYNLLRSNGVEIGKADFLGG